MRNLIITQNITLDGVIDAAGGWFEVGNDADLDDVAETLREHSADSDALLVGRVDLRVLPLVLAEPGRRRDRRARPSQPRAQVRRLEHARPSPAGNRPRSWASTTSRRSRSEPGRDIVCTGSLTLVPRADRARARRRVPAVRLSGRARRRSAAVHAGRRRRAGRDAPVPLGHRAAALSPRLVAAATSTTHSGGPRSPLPGGGRRTRTTSMRAASARAATTVVLAGYAPYFRPRPLATRVPCVCMDVLGACPLDCPDGCSWVVTVEDGQAVRLRGNREHPFTAGALCAKVNGYLEHTRAPDRLLYPLRRVGAKGSGEFERISWDEALRRDRRQAARASATSSAARRSGRSRAPARSATCRGSKGRAGQRLWNVLGASRHDMTICSIAGRFGATYVTGTAAGMDPETFAQSKLILLWGTNTLTSGHHLWKFVLAARKNGAHIVAIDPLKTRTAGAGRRASRAAAGHRRRARARPAERDRRDGRPGRRLPGASTRSAGRRSANASSSTRRRGWRRSPASTKRRSSRSGSGSRPRARPASAARWACSATPAAATRCGCCTRCPGVTGDWQYPGGGASYSTSPAASARTSTATSATTCCRRPRER